MKQLGLKRYNQNCCYEIIIDYNRKYFKKTLLNTNSKSSQLLTNELKILEVLKSFDVFPKICKVDLKNTEIIYEYIEGIRLNKIGIMNIEQTLYLIIKIIEILQIVHSNDIVHCDLKPDNIIINDNKIYLIDFGISQYKNVNDFLGYGSIRYCAPEQYNREKIDNKVDIYALGIIMYELITDKQIFDSKSKKFILNHKLNGKLPRISDCILNIPIELENIFEKATKVKKEERYNNIEEMKIEINNVLDKYYKGGNNMNENKYNKYLPIGTIVLLKNGKKKVMITGFCTTKKNKIDKFYDYNGCVYPEGIISSNMILLFNHNQIDKVYHLGYRDNEEIEFKKYLDSCEYNIN